MLFCIQANALESLSYSGRLVQTNGAPVTGTVTIRAELVYTNNTAVVLCSDDIAGVALSKGVFHVKIEFACTGGKTLTQVLSQAPVGESVAIQITDVTNSKSYSFQALHALPYANVASQLVQMGAGDGEFLKWDDTNKQWKPGTVSGASGGTVTSVSVSAPLSIATPTSTPSITLPQANGSTSGYLSSADWNSFNSKEGTIAGGTATQYYRGDKTWQTLDTNVVPENVNLYFTNARALGVPLTGFATAAGAIVAADTTLQAFGKAQGQINAINTASANYLIKNSTDSVTGVVNVGTTGLLQLVYVPVGMNDATNKAYVDSEVGTKVSTAGDTVTGVLTLDNDLRIKGGSNHVTVSGHASSANYNLILPSGAGSSGQFLQTDGSGNLSWVAQSSTAAPTGSAGGDLAGTYPNPTVPGLASKISTTLNSGNILVGNGSNVATAVAVSGDATLSNAGVLTLANTAVTAGTYKSVTVDGKGRVTGGTNPTTLAGYGITDTLVTGVSVTAPITNTGSAAVPLIGMPVATGSADGYLSSANFNTFNNKQNAITTATAVTAGSVQTNLQGGLLVNPYSTGAGNTGEARFYELVANGSNYTGFKSPDALAGNVIYTLPSTDGSNGQVLTTNSTGGLSWTTAATSSSSLTGDIGGTIGANTIGAGKVTLTHLSATGTRDNTTYLRGDNTFAAFAADVRTSVLTGLSTSTNAVITAADSVLSSLGKLQKQISDFAVSAVGGDLSGNLPNPTVAKIQGRAVTSTAPLAGQVLKYNTGTPAWEPSYVLVGDLKSSALGNLFPGTGCAANQTLYYSVVGDAFTCVNIDSLDAGKITTGTIAAARLPSSATYWQAATGGINFAGGKVGIGTTAPQELLHVEAATSGRMQVGTGNILSTSGYGISLESDTDDGVAYINTHTQAVGANSAALIFRGGHGATETAATRTIASFRTDSGNVGIGTASPATKLDVRGGTDPVAIRLTEETGSDAVWEFRAYNTGLGGSDNQFSIWGGLEGASQTDRLIISKDGNVGIGNINPTAALDISNTGGETIILRDNDNLVTDVAYASYIRSKDSAGTNAWYLGDGSSGAGGLWLLNYQANPIHFATSGTTKMTVDSTGNVGIGTTSPIDKLSILDSSHAKVRVSGDSDLDQASLFLLELGPVGSESGFELNFNGANGAGGNSFNLNSYTAGVATNRLTVLRDNGNVGIGTTTPGFKLDVSGLTAIGGTNLDPVGSPSFTPLQNTGKMLVGWNRNAGNGEVDLISNRGAGTRGGFNFYDYTNAGVLNHLVNFDGNGNVGIGVLIPTQKLDVAGSILTSGGHIGTNLFNGSFGTSTSRAFLGSTGYIWSTMDNGGGSSNLYLHRHDVSQYYVQFGYGAANVGTISTNGSSVSYNTTSDYRLKENVVPMDDALKRVLLIQPKRFNYITTPNETVDGFIAHELAIAVPEAVHGKKDGVDKDGKIIPQFVDYSKVVPVITGAVKELYRKFLGHDEQLAIQARAIASKADKTEIESLKNQNKKLQQENDAIKAYLCKKDPKAPICK